MDQPSEKCSDASLKPDVTRCITKYIEKVAGCTLPVQGANEENMTLCKNMNQIHKFLDLNRFKVVLNYN